MIKTDSTQTTLVDDSNKWIPLTDDQIRLVGHKKVLLIDRDSGVSVISTISIVYTNNGNYQPISWTHWAPLPVFDD